MPDLHLFEGYGVELEYMIVDRKTLKVLPIADKVLEKMAGEQAHYVENGNIALCNELVLHVLEFKTNGPSPSLNGLSKDFANNINKVNGILTEWDAMLLPTAMHPFMNPYTEMKLWPHSNKAIYELYNNIFDCRGHGWANLQSVHLNLPFANDSEFEKLHAAIRMILPILPAIAASSPIKDSTITGVKDTRLDMYRFNQAKIPSLTGKIIPEQVWSQKEYLKNILEVNFRDIKPHDPEGILQEEWLNSRGAIARFSRMAIEIRLLDIQECPAADIAILKLINSTLVSLTNEDLCSLNDQKSFNEDHLYPILLSTLKNGENSVIDNKMYLKSLGINDKQCLAQDIWSHLFNRKNFDKEESEILTTILSKGTLSSRITLAAKERELKDIYFELAKCLSKNSIFKI
jgi:glutamate---cysteine ligase / carboxylate-amine ligase